MDKLQEAIETSTMMKKVPPATRQIFEHLLRQDVKFFEAGILTPRGAFISGTINGQAFALTISIGGDAGL